MPYERAGLIADAKSTSLKRLAEVAGGDPRTFYRAADFRGLDLSGQDLSGFDLSDTDFTDVKINLATRVDPQFFPRLGEAARLRLASEIEGADRRVRGRAIVRLIGLEQRLSRQQNAILLLDDLLSSDAAIPLRFDEFSPASMPGKLLELLSKRYIEQNGEMSAFDRTMRALLASPLWGAWALDTAFLYSEMGITNAACRRPLMALTTAIAAQGGERAGTYVHQWSERFGMRPDAIFVLMRLLPQEPFGPALVWAQRWEEEHQSRPEAGYLRLALALLSLIPGGTRMPLVREPNYGEEFAAAMVTLSELAHVLDRAPASPVAEGLADALELVEGYVGFVTDVGAGQLSAFSQEQRDVFRASSRKMLDQFRGSARRRR